MRRRFTTLSNSLTLGIGPTRTRYSVFAFDLILAHECVVDAFGAQLSEQFGCVGFGAECACLYIQVGCGSRGRRRRRFASA